ncbi:MAG: serine/threonine protein kinase [Gammaproteobacteria bacterium]|jgi:Ser/Thr protein kinase RdoA (MazF antagonist)|nr:serine/threonine protein kinase [Gammaproteobacteria bacterium]
MNDQSTPYHGLTPDRILDIVESFGVEGDGRVLTLNSYENRVYQIGTVDGPPLIAKFYRPGRWSDGAILEEHRFVASLAEREVPVVAPLEIRGETLLHAGGHRVALYPRQSGRAPELLERRTLEWMGRFLGRIHAVGAIGSYRERPAIDIDTFGHEPREFLLASDFIAVELRQVWEGVSAQALEGVARCFARAGKVKQLRLHGDCHVGNVLWADDGPHFVDFDDSRTGPAVQDLWMLISGEREEMEQQLGWILSGYEDFHPFDRRELHLVEALRTLRLIHYSGWIARRWHDPAFPAAFPWFGSQRYWQDRILELREQIAAMDEGPLGSG